MNNASLFLPMLSLLFILALVIFGYVAVNGKKNRITNNKGFKELNKFYLTPKSYISIVKIGEKYYCLGVSEQNINLITKISQEEVEKYFSGENSLEMIQNFSEILKNAKILEKFKNKRDEENEKGH